MSIELVQTAVRNSEVASYGLWEALPFEDNASFRKLNTALANLGLNNRWRVVREKDSKMIFAQGLWTKHESERFMKSIVCKGRIFIPSTDTYKREIMGKGVTYSTLIDKAILNELIENKILKISYDEERIDPNLVYTSMALPFWMLGQPKTSFTLVPEDQTVVWFNVSTIL